MSEKKIVIGLIAFPFIATAILIGLIVGFKVDVEGIDEEGTTHLMRAVRSGDYATTAELLIRGAEVNARNKAGWTPIMYASNNASPQIVQLLLEHGAEVNNPQGSPTSPLHLSIEAEKPFIDRFVVMDILLKNNADVGFVDELGVTPIMTATRRSSHEMTEVVKALKKSGADINGISNGYTPLSYAIHIAEDDEKARETVLALMEHGANPNISTGVTALMAAVMESFHETAYLLIEKKVNKELVNTDGKTAMDIAVLYEKVEFFELLQ